MESRSKFWESSWKQISPGNRSKDQICPFFDGEMLLDWVLACRSGVGGVNEISWRIIEDKLVIKDKVMKEDKGKISVFLSNTRCSLASTQSLECHLFRD